jgi:hypothetical protein
MNKTTDNMAFPSFDLIASGITSFWSKVQAASKLTPSGRPTRRAGEPKR